MKKIIFILSSICLIIVTSCKRDSIDNKQAANNPLNADNFKKYKQDAGGDVFITLDEYFDQPVTLTSTTISASFKNNSTLLNVNEVSLNGKYKLNRKDANRFLLNNGINSKELLNNNVRFELGSANPNFQKMDSNIQIDNNIQVKTNMGLEGILKKNQDLVIKWIPRDKSGNVSLRGAETIYLGIAAAGVAPISREIPDNGQVTISASELSSFPNNAQAVVRLGRVSQTCTTQNGQTVCFNVINSASSGPLVIQ